MFYMLITIKLLNLNWLYSALKEEHEIGDTIPL